MPGGAGALRAEALTLTAHRGRAGAHGAGGPAVERILPTARLADPEHAEGAGPALAVARAHALPGLTHGGRGLRAVRAREPAVRALVAGVARAVDARGPEAARGRSARALAARTRRGLARAWGAPEPARRRRRAGHALRREALISGTARGRLVALDAAAAVLCAHAPYGDAVQAARTAARIHVACLAEARLTRGAWRAARHRAHAGAPGAERPIRRAAVARLGAVRRGDIDVRTYIGVRRGGIGGGRHLWLRSRIRSSLWRSGGAYVVIPERIAAGGVPDPRVGWRLHARPGIRAPDQSDDQQQRATSHWVYVSMRRPAPATGPTPLPTAIAFSG